MKNKKDVDILSTTADSEYDPDYTFDYEKGFNVAAAFTAYDSNPEPILDETIGEIVFQHHFWEPLPDGG